MNAIAKAKENNDTMTVRDKKLTPRVKEMYQPCEDYFLATSFKDGTKTKLISAAFGYFKYLDIRGVEFSAKSAQAFIDYSIESGYDDYYCDSVRRSVNMLSLKVLKAGPMFKSSVKLRAYDGNNEPLTDLQFSDLIKNLDPQIKAMMRISRSCGITINRLSTILISEFDFKKKKVVYEFWGVDTEADLSDEIIELLKPLKVEAQKVKKDDFKKGIHNPGFMFPAKKPIADEVDGVYKLVRDTIRSTVVSALVRRAGEKVRIKGVKLSCTR